MKHRYIIFIDPPGAETIFIGKTATQQKIMLVLSRGKELSVREISYRAGLKFNAVYKELQRMLQLKYVLKVDRKYKMHPDYPEMMLKTAMKLLESEKLPPPIIITRTSDQVIELMVKLKKMAAKES